MFSPFEVQNPNLYVIVTLLQTPAFFSLWTETFCFDTLCFFCWGKYLKSGLLIYISEGCFCFFFLNWGITSEGLFFIIGFYEVFKKKSFKQRLCLACNTLCALCLLFGFGKYTHQYISHGAIATIAESIRN